MEHQNKILKLADFLEEMGLEKEARDLLSLLEKKAVLKPPAVDEWYQVLDTADASYENEAGMKTISRYLSVVERHLAKAGPGLQGVKAEDIKAITDNVPLEQLVSTAAKRDNLVKFASASNEDALIAVAEICVSEGWIQKPDYKKAAWWQYVKTIGGAALKYLVPFVSLLFAIMNLYYCAVELSKLMTDAPDIGLAWYEPVFAPNKTLQMAKQNIEDPGMLEKLVKLNKTGKTFADEAISGIANGIDGVKDVIFLFLNLASFGTSIWLDLGISFAIMIVEWLIEGAILPIFDQATTLIRGKAVEEIKTHHSTSLRTRIDETFAEKDYGFTPEELAELNAA